jgi:transposase, IS5 family
MRKLFRTQVLSCNLRPIDEIEVPAITRSRLYPTLIALQEIYKTNKEMVNLVYEDLLSDYSHTTNDLIDPILFEYIGLPNDVSDNSDESLGAPGMTAWQTLVAVTLRQALNLTYDELGEYFNHNTLVREFLEISVFEDILYSQSRLGKNCRKVRPETLQEIDNAVIQVALDYGFEDGKSVRGDSFACKTNIHHPSDTKAIQEACKKVILLCVRIVGSAGGWRQQRYWLQKIKKLARNLVQKKRSKKRDKVLKSEEIKHAYKELIEAAREIQSKVFRTWDDNIQHDLSEELGYYMCCLEIMVDLAERRTQHGETIDSSEKIFSIFEPHTELIHRGKYPLPIEYGHRVFIAEGKSGIILDHRILENGVLDQHETLPVINRLVEKYGRLDTLSLDKGFNIKGFDPGNQQDEVSLFVLPAKGYKKAGRKEKESQPEFVKARNWRAGVESSIGALMRGNGGGICRDKQVRGYRRWIAACVLSRNLITLGRLIQARELKEAG